MARTPFSQAVHRSVQRAMRNYEKTGEISGQKVANKADAVQIATQNAYNRVNTPLVKGDIGPRSGRKPGENNG